MKRIVFSPFNSSGNFTTAIALSTLMAIAALYMLDYLTPSFKAIEFSTSKQTSFYVAEKIFYSIKASFEKIKDSNSCLADTSEFYKFNNPATTPPASIKITNKTELLKCQIDAQDLKKIEKVDIEVTRDIGPIDASTKLSEDAVLGLTRVKILLNLTLQPEGDRLTYEIKDIRYLRLRIASLADFALVVPNFDTTKLYAKVSDTAKLNVLGSVFIHNPNKPLPLDNLIPAKLIVDASVTNSSIVFQDNVLTNSSYLALPALSDKPILPIINLEFNAGIYFNELSMVKTMPFDFDKKYWDQPVDYLYHYGPVAGFALPAIKATKPFVSDAYAIDPNTNLNTTMANPLNGTIKEFPATGGSIIPNLKDTCTDKDPVVFYKKDVDLSFDLSNSRSLCGLIFANKLKIIIPGGKTSILIGSFWANHLEIEVSGSGIGKLFIFNPLKYKTAPYDLLNDLGIEFESISQKLEKMRLTLGYNFFIPLYKVLATDVDLSGDFAPKEISDNRFFEACGEPSGSDPFQCWHQSVSAPDLNNLYAVTEWYNKIHFYVEETY